MPLPAHHASLAHCFAAGAYEAHARRHRERGRRELVGELVPVGGRQIHLGNAPMCDLPHELTGLEGRPVAPQDQRCTHDERREDLLDGHIEGERSELEHPVVSP